MTLNNSIGLWIALCFLWLGASEAAAVDSKMSRRPWMSDVALGGVVGTWSRIPLAEIRGAIPMGERLSLRIGWALFFDSKDDKQFSYSRFSLDLLIRLPSPHPTFRYYALTRLDFWPLWDFFNINPNVRDISLKPAFGFSVLLGVEAFVIQRLALFLETGFSSGMLLGFEPIASRYQGFGFLIQSGIQVYF